MVSVLVRDTSGGGSIPFTLMTTVEKQKAARRRHYQANKEVYRSRLQERRQRWRDWLWGIKSTLSCEQCGLKHPAALDYHHMIPHRKVQSIADMVVACVSMEIMLQEMAKCRVLCASCHRILEFEERHMTIVEVWTGLSQDAKARLVDALIEFRAQLLDTQLKGDSLGVLVKVASDNIDAFVVKAGAVWNLPNRV